MRRILSTRKIKPALADKAGKAGVEILEREMIGIKFHSPEIIREHIKRTKNKTTVFTSAHAVEAVDAALNNDSKPSWEIFCIGGATKDAVNGAFPDSVICGTGDDGTSLAQLMTGSVEPQPVTFFCGSRRRDELPDLLKKNNFSVEEIEVYETVLTPSVVNERYDGIMFFSPSAAESYLSLNQIPEHIVCFSIGKTTTGYLHQHTKSKIVTAPEVSEESMINIIINYQWN